MRKIRVEKLTRDAFNAFGMYYDFAEPEGYALTGELHRFYPDRLRDAEKTCEVALTVDAPRFLHEFRARVLRALS